MATGKVDPGRLDAILAGLKEKGFAHICEPGALEITEDTEIGRETYISMFGPTTGDRVRLGDTALWIEVEDDKVMNLSYFVIKRLTRFLFYFTDRLWR